MVNHIEPVSWFSLPYSGHITAHSRRWRTLQTAVTPHLHDRTLARPCVVQIITIEGTGGGTAGNSCAVDVGTKIRVSVWLGITYSFSWVNHYVCCSATPPLVLQQSSKGTTIGEIGVALTNCVPCGNLKMPSRALTEKQR